MTTYCTDRYHGRAARPVELDPDCPNGRCPHRVDQHEPDDYDLDGSPCRGICCVDGCRCGDEYRIA